MGKKGKSIKKLFPTKKGSLPRIFPTKKEIGFFGKPVHSKTRKHLK